MKMRIIKILWKIDKLNSTSWNLKYVNTFKIWNLGIHFVCFYCFYSFHFLLDRKKNGKRLEILVCWRHTYVGKMACNFGVLKVRPAERQVILACWTTTGKTACDFGVLKARLGKLAYHFGVHFFADLTIFSPHVLWQEFDNNHRYFTYQSKALKFYFGTENRFISQFSYFYWKQIN